jgi:hypothetical protein
MKCVDLSLLCIWSTCVVNVVAATDVGGFDSDDGTVESTGESIEWALPQGKGHDSFVPNGRDDFYFDKDGVCSRPILPMGRTALDGSQGNRKRIRTLCVTGERHSGTNFLHALLENNFKYTDSVYLPAVSWLHIVMYLQMAMMTIFVTTYGYL